MHQNGQSTIAQADPLHGDSLILAIETSTDQCSVALRSVAAGQLSVHDKGVEGSKRHAESVLVFIDALLVEQQHGKRALTHIAYGRGPGAFTGVRLSIAVAQGLAYALSLPTLGVSTLQACALDALQHYPELQHPGVTLGVLLDARMGELYALKLRVVERTLAGHTMLLPEPICEEALLRMDALADFAPDAGEPTHWVGSGAQLHAEVLQLRGAGVWSANPSARAIAQLAPWSEALPAELAQPVYLRNQVAQTIVERKLAAEQKSRGSGTADKSRGSGTADKLAVQNA